MIYVLIKCKLAVTGVTLYAFLVSAMVMASGQQVLVTSAAELEARLEARVGLSVHDLETGRRWQYRADERFPLSSTFKTLACAALLKRVDVGQESLGRRIRFAEADLVSYSPVTQLHVGGEGMTLAELCGATMSMSDNSAANFILAALGGPQAVTRFMREIGDPVTRLDRRETELNESLPGDPRDSTSPNAMVASLQTLLLDKELSPDSRRQLRQWLEGNQVGGPLFRAAIPDTWVVGDRTGAGGYGSRSITAIIWAPGRRPVIAALYITESTVSLEVRNKAIAGIGRILVAEILSAY